MINNLIRFYGQQIFKRRNFLKILPKNSIGLELGVFRGEFSEQILNTVHPKELHLVDVWWVMFGDNYPDWGAYTNYGKLTTAEAYNDVLEVISSTQSEDKCKIHVGDDLEYLQTFDDYYFDWAYIDSSHSYEHTVREIELLSHKVKPDGIICGHDWQPNASHRHHGVYKAVKEFVDRTDWAVIKTDIHTQWAIRQQSR